jgi:TonB family protein
MSARSSAIASFALALAVTAPLPAAGQAPVAATTEPVGDAVKRPLSPGAVALLLPHASNPQVADRLEEALGHTKPDVRAVAARAAFSTRHQKLLPALTAALVTEADDTAAVEMVRAIALIAGPAGDEAAFAAIARLGDPAATAWLDVVGRTRAPDALTRLVPLGEAAGEALLGLASTHPDVVVAALAPLPTEPGLEPAYLAMIARADRATTPTPWPVIAAGLKASPAVRRSVVRMLLRRQARQAALPPEAPGALDGVRALVTAAEDPWLAMVFELVRRGERTDSAPTPLGPAIAAIDPAKVPNGAWSDVWLRRLAASEESALRARVPELPPRDQWEGEPRPPARGAPVVPTAPPSGLVIRMMRPVAPTLAADLAALTGCAYAAHQVVAVEVAFKPTGQVREVFAPVGVGVARCGRAAQLLATLDLAGGSAPLPPGRADLLMIGFRPEDADCPRRPASLRIKGARPGGRVRAPRKIRNVQPVYPQEMQDGRIQGMTIIEATISTAGCVAEATVLTGPHPTLNAAALAAVSIWRYEPTLLDDKPVPVIMTVTVNFALQ